MPSATVSVNSSGVATISAHGCTPGAFAGAVFTMKGPSISKSSRPGIMLGRIRTDTLFNVNEDGTIRLKAPSSLTGPNLPGRVTVTLVTNAGDVVDGVADV